MLYPPLTPRRTGLLDVGDGHCVFWEDSGNPHGRPVVVLHGGPGAGCTDLSRRWFDPRHYRIVTFDQRGCGRSTPKGCLSDNTTWDLVRDIETLRGAMDVDSWIVFGRSWGATLALAYAEHHPTRVIAILVNAVFTARQAELAWLYGGGAAQLASVAWTAFAGAKSTASSVLHHYYRQLTCGDAGVEMAAAERWCAWEDRLTLGNRPRPPLTDYTALVRARIGAHYFVNAAFLREGELLDNARALADIPGIIVQGAADVVTPAATAHDLHCAWPGSQLRIVAEAGHATTEPAMMRALVDAGEGLALDR